MRTEQADGPHPAPAQLRSSSRRWAIGGVAVALVLGLAIPLAARSAGESDAPASSSAAPRFVDATAESGLDHVYDGEFEFFVGGGVASFDCDDDGRPELYVAGGTEPASLFLNRSERGGSVRFERLTSDVTDLTRATGAYPIDIDGDRRVDLAVLRHGENVLLRGLGECVFERANDRFGFDGGEAWTTALSATWEGTNALPTLAVGNYLAPERDACDVSHLVRPAGDERYGAPVELTPGYCTLSVLFSDWSGTGRRDLRMTNDRHYYTDGQEQLWWIEPDAPPRAYTEADGWRPLQVWGMGIASHDVTGDGLPEVFLTSQGDNKLQTLAEGPSHPAYRDIALRRGVTAQRPFAGGDVLPSTAWHPEFADVNNDAFTDLFVTKGNVEAQPDHASRDPNNLLIGRPDGTFFEGAEAAGIVEFERARGAAVVDLDLDGLLDLVVVHRREPVAVWRNVGSGSVERPEPMGRWSAIRLRQPEPNVDAIGARVEVRTGDRTQVRELTVGGGHAGGQLGWIHVGLGERGDAELRVRWPDGELGPWMTVTADRFVVVERGRPEPRLWAPPD